MLHKPRVIWVTGLSGTGKTTLCKALWSSLKPSIPELVLLDGDLIRDVFAHDLGYAQEDRLTQVRRIQKLAKMLSEQSIFVLAAVLYSNPDLLAWNRQNIPGYFEVYLEASVDILCRRDQKGLYQKALSGETKNVVGVDIPWQKPLEPDLVLNANTFPPPDWLAREVIRACHLT